MKPALTDITIVLDRSGSMQTLKNDVIGGLNEFLNEQEKAPGEATVTLVQFDNEYESVYEARPIGKAPRLTHTSYIPRGTTALLDAIGRTIDSAGLRLAAIPEQNRPGKVLFVIQTDGLENSSTIFSLQQVNEKITLQRDRYQWQFVFLGANQDAIATAASMNIPAHSTMSYAATPTGTQSVSRETARAVMAWRAGTTASVMMSDEERKKQKAEGAQ